MTLPAGVSYVDRVRCLDAGTIVCRTIYRQGSARPVAVIFTSFCQSAQEAQREAEALTDRISDQTARRARAEARHIRDLGVMRLGAGR